MIQCVTQYSDVQATQMLRDTPNQQTCITVGTAGLEF